MGICCGKNNVGDQSILQDLPQPDIGGLKDRYQIWEYQTPFKRTPFKAFKLAVQEASESCGGGEAGYVTLDSLATHLNT